MRGPSRIMAMMVLVSLSAMLSGMQAFAAPAMGHPAGCHQMPGVPAPAPTSFQCCSSGHHWAMTSAAVVVSAPAAAGAQVDQGRDLFSVDGRGFSFPFLSSSPPDCLPLRI